MITSMLLRPRLRFVGGVCAGFADHTGVPVGLVRTVTVLLTVCGGAGALLYAWLWATTPSTDAAGPLPSSLSWAGGVARRPGQGRPPETIRTRPVTELLLGAALLAAGGALVLARFGAQVPLELVIPAIVMLAGAALAWRQFADLRSGTDASGVLARILAALVFVALGILLFFVTGTAPNVWTVMAAALAVLAGVGLVVAPWIVRLARDLTQERSARAREAERAEIAAHLHDSVLQTLALIQQKAGPRSEAARLARAQERELRTWLFAGGPVATGDLAEEVRAVAAALEAEHPVRFEVVTAGGVAATAPEGLVAAVREAMLNAARHAGGDVSVYVETAPDVTEVIITDRGPGFSLDAMPHDRFGVRESIIGRVQRSGGTARIGPGPGGRGTSVMLRMPMRTDTEGSTP